MKNKITLFLILSFSALLFAQCNKEEEAMGADLELFNLATATTGFSWFQTDSIRASSNPSAHNAYMRVRFNQTAAAILGSDGKLPVGASFPNGSLIVKELYDSPTGSLQLYAIMQKDSTDSNAGANWLWAEIKPDSKVVFSVSEKGDGCTGCHGSTPNREFSRVFDQF